MDADELFLRTMNDLDEAVANPDNYRVLRAAALLRQLLLDGNTLIDRVNRKYREKIHFRIADVWNSNLTKLDMAHNPVWYCPLDAVDPACKFPGQTCIKLSRDAFLAYRAIYVSGTYLTIAELIRHAANCMGGVHVGDPKGTDEQILSTLNSSAEIGGGIATLRQLLPVCTIVRTALEPLKQRILASRP